MTEVAKLVKTLNGKLWANQVVAVLKRAGYWLFMGLAFLMASSLCILVGFLFFRAGSRVLENSETWYVRMTWQIVEQLSMNLLLPLLLVVVGLYLMLIPVVVGLKKGLQYLLRTITAQEAATQTITVEG